MKPNKTNLIYFSATGTTATIISAIEEGIGIKDKNIIDLTLKCPTQVTIPNSEIAIFGVPVFSGRVPNIAKQRIEQIKGENTPAIIVCIYGNRDFDDALIELKDIVENNGFCVISAAAFIAQHSIFPKVATGRPNKSDLLKAKEFGTNSIKNILETTPNPNPLEVKGNRPYKAVKPIPLTPATNNKCNQCKICIKQCPVKAIDPQNPKKTDKTICISCAHCIAVCPQNAKRFKGLLYWLVAKKFTKNNSQPKEPYIIYNTEK